MTEREQEAVFDLVEFAMSCHDRLIWHEERVDDVPPQIERVVEMLTTEHEEEDPE